MHVSSWQAAYRDILPAEYLAGLQWEKRYELWQRELIAPSVVGRSTWVLAEGTAVLGFVSTGPARDDDRQRADAWELYAIYLTEDRWGQGLRRALADVALDAVPDQVADVSLWGCCRETISPGASMSDWASPSTGTSRRPPSATTRSWKSATSRNEGLDRPDRTDVAFAPAFKENDRAMSLA